MRLPPPVPTRLLAALGTGAVVVALLAGGRYWPEAVAGGLLLLLAAAYSRGDGLLLLGPLARWQLVRTARRGRLFSSRVLVAGVVVLICAGVFRSTLAFEDDPLALELSARKVGRLAYYTFAALVGLLVLVAGLRAVFSLPAVVAEEREGQRLDHLLVTDLRSHEILLGKTAGLLAPTVAEVLVPLPVLAVTAAYGGVDPVYLAAAGVLAGGLLVGTLGVAVGCSAGSRSVSAAVGKTVGVLAVLFVGTLLLSLAAGNPGKYLPVPTAWEPAVAEGMDVLAAGNPAVFIRVMAVSTSPAAALVQLDHHGRHFLAWHLVVLLVGWRAAVKRLRPTPHRRPTPAPKRTAPTAAHQRRWRWPWWLAPALVVLVFAAVGLFGSVHDMLWLLDVLFRASGPFAFLFVTLPIGWAAARELPTERQRDTLDPLLLTAMSPTQIVLRAWRRAIVSAAGRAAAVAVVLVGTVLFGVSLGPTVGTKTGLLVGVVALNMIANALLAASFGVLVSVPFPTPRKAVGVALLVALYWWGGWLGWYIGSDDPAAGQTVLTLVAPAAQGAATLGERLPEYGEVLFWNTALSAGAAVGLLAAACGWFHRRVRPKPEAPA